MLCLTAGLPDSVATLYYRVLHGSNLWQLQLQLRQQLLYQPRISSVSTQQLQQLQSLPLHSPTCQQLSSMVASIFFTQLQLLSSGTYILKKYLCMVTNRFPDLQLPTPSSDVKRRPIRLAWPSVNSFYTFFVLLSH
jgi:hypothetical protein